MLKSCAKVNLFLNIVDKKSCGLYEGYHGIESFFIPLELYDYIYLQYNMVRDVVYINNNLLFNRDHIIYKTLDIFRKHSNIKRYFSVSIKKNIPTGSGLGGYSSNSASILKELCKKYKVKMPNICNIARYIGADVPFFIKNQNAFVEGIGEFITHIRPSIKLFILLIYPGINIPTKEVFLGIENICFSKKLNKNRIINEVMDGKNALEAFVSKKYDTVRHLLFDLKHKRNCIVSRMSGSGSTCFCLFKNKDELLNARRDMEVIYPNFWFYHQLINI